MRGRRLLCIGIPTRNGAATIKETLLSILVQMDRNISCKVQILISDNASTDGTAEIVRLLQLRHSQIITSSRNTVDIGFDGNVDQLVRMAESRFLWFLSDDDALYPYSLRHVIRVLEDNVCSPKAVFVNYEECDANLRAVSERIRPDVFSDQYCCEHRDFFRKTKMLFGLISSIIVDCDEWRKHDFRRYYGQGWLHVVGMAHVLRGGPGHVLSRKMVKLRTENIRNAVWDVGGRSLEVGLNLPRFFREMERLGYDSLTCRQLVRRCNGGNLHLIVRACRRNVKHKVRLVRRMVEVYYDFPLLWLLQIPVFVLPNALVKLFWRVRLLWPR